VNSIFDSRILNLVIFSPLVVATLVAFLPREEKSQIRGITFAGMLFNFATCMWALIRFEPANRVEFQLEYLLEWVPSMGLSYHVGVDGLSMALVALTGVLGPLVVLASWTYIQERVKEFHLALLILQTAMLGAVCSVDVLLFYMFFEAMLIPMYLLIGVWGSEERQMAAMKFFLYTLVGSLLMLVALLGVYFIAAPAGQRSFDYATLYNGMLAGNRELAAYMAQNPNGDGATLSGVALSLFKFGPYMFVAFALAFAIKVPMFPLHTWLPDAHVQAPAAGSIILAGVMLKMGTYGFWRFAIPLFPNALRLMTPEFNMLTLSFLHVPSISLQVFVGLLAVIGIIYGALMSLAQRDIKKLIAYSSVSHLGYCMLGMFALTGEGATGSAYQMLNHGVSTGALFMLFGFLYERRHARLMSDYGGIAKVMPVFTALFVVVTFSSVAVPGTNGFVGEFLVLLGTVKSTLPLWMGVAASTAVVLGAAYMLWMVQKVFFGPLTHPENMVLQDLNKRELFAVLPFVLLIVVMGLKPQPFLDVLNHSTERFVSRAQVGSGTTSDSDDKRLRVYVRKFQPTLAQVDALPSNSALPVNNQIRPMPMRPMPTLVQPSNGGTP
jgi:NADH-quinone oxidoreductase subunit M